MSGKAPKPISFTEEYSHFQPLLVRNSRKSECGFKLGRIRGVEGGLVALRGL